MRAERHPFELRRIAALRRYDILDTPTEADYDDVVRLASQVCNTPISVINLIDSDRQWFKAEVGLGVRETPLETSLCAHVILENDFVEIEDTLVDQRMCDNPLCLSEPGLRFYAGALLRSPDGMPIGTLCVLDHIPRRLTDWQREALGTLARQVMTNMNLTQALSQHQVLRKEIDHRVKNSLMAVSSFVLLEQAVAENGSTYEALGRISQQIKSVAALHELLAADHGNAVVSLKDYLEKVVMQLRIATPVAIEIERYIEDVTVIAQDATVLATIINELVANSVKHALRSTGGHIILSGRLTEGGEYHLSCRDNGKAKDDLGDELSDSLFKDDDRQKLGLAIVEASVGQLSGTISSGPTDTGYLAEIRCRLRSEQP